MFVLRRLPACFALVILGALSLRLGLPILLAGPLALALLVLLFVPVAALQLALSGVLWAGAVAWLGMVWMRVGERLEAGQDWKRLAAILVGVALFTAWSAWLLRSQTGQAPHPDQG